MPDFEIAFANSTIPTNGVQLVFRSKESMKLTAKSVSFHPSVKDEITLIYPIFPNENGKICTFQYPDPNAIYKKLTFDLQQKGLKGWNVTVDLEKRKINIKESQYQI